MGCAHRSGSPLPEARIATTSLEDVRIPGGGATVLLDVDGTLVADSAESIGARAETWVRELAQQHSVYLCSNTPDRPRLQRIASHLGLPIANHLFTKPNPRIVHELARRPQQLVVVGDKIIVDGLFSMLTHAKFIHIRRLQSGHEPLSVRLAYWLDDLVSWVLKPVLR